MQSMAFCGRGACMMLRLLLGLFALFLACSCQDYEEKERVIGYKGKARVNPFLAFEKFVGEYSGSEMITARSWRVMDDEDAVLISSVDMLTTKEHVARVGQWVSDGGHAIFLIDHAESRGSDWLENEEHPVVSEPLKKFFEEAGISVTDAEKEQEFNTVTLEEETFGVRMRSRTSMSYQDQKNQGLVNAEWGDGLITIISDARMLRNRFIDEQQHADVVARLLDWSRAGRVIMMRGVGISFFGLLWEKSWMVLVSGGLLLLVWLLRHMPRFGPIDGEARQTQMRAYDHHLEMIGDFHWRLDRGASLLQPLRQELQELCHQWQVKTGRLDEGLFDVMAAQSGIPAERVQRAMTEHRASDSLVFSRAVADLQQIRKAFL